MFSGLYRRETNLPFEIYASLVDALFDDRRSLFLGSASASIAAIITGLKSGHWLLIAFGVALASASYLRALDMRAYARIRKTLTSEAAVRSWELRYVAGAAIY